MADGPSSTIVFDGDSSGAVAALHAVDVEAKRLAASLKDTAGKMKGSTDVPETAPSVKKLSNLAEQIKRLSVDATYGKDSVESLYRKIERAGGDRDTFKPLVDAYGQVKTARDQANAEFTKSGKVMTEYGMGVKATSAALRQVPAQFTDIIVSLQGGQAPLTVLLQQGGQLKDVFGGVGNAFKALGGYIIGLVTPYTVAAAAILSLAYAYTKGAAEAEGYSKALIISGNAAGTTAQNMSAMAIAVSRATGGTIGTAAEALTALASTGTIAASQFVKLSEAATMMQKSTGAAVADTVKKFAELGKDPLTASIKLNEATNYLTSSVYMQIKALVEQGDVIAAGVVAQNAYASVMINRTPDIVQNLGYIEQAWMAVARATGMAIDGYKGIGREGDAVENLQKQIAVRQGFIRDNRTGAIPEGDATLVALNQQLSRLKENLSAKQAMAEYQKKEAESTKATIAFETIRGQFLSNELKMQREIAAVRTAFIGQKPEDRNAAALAETIKGIQDRYKEPSNKGAARAANALGKSQLDLDLENIKAGLAKQTEAYAGANKVLDALRSAGLTSEQDYYASRRQLIELTTNAQDIAWQKEIDRLKGQKYAGENAAAEMVKRDQKIVEIEAMREKAHAQAASGNVAATIAETSALNKIARAYDDANAAAQEYLRITTQAHNNELSRMGIGNRARGVSAGIDQINTKYEADNFRNEKYKNDNSTDGIFNNADAQKVYDDESARLSAFKSKSLAEWQDYTDRKKLIDGDWTVGAKESLLNYADSASNVAKSTEQLFTNAFKGMEDALVDFVKTGTLDFSKLADSIIGDLIRITVQSAVTGPIAAALGLSSIFGGARASGGPVAAGKIYQVNENGPELLNVAGKQYLMTGNKGGSITPNGGTSGGGQNITVIQNFTVGDVASVSMVRQAVAGSEKRIAAGIGRSMSYGGALA